MNRPSRVRTNLLSVPVTSQFVCISDKSKKKFFSLSGGSRRRKERGEAYNRLNEENVTYNRVDDAYRNVVVNIDFQNSCTLTIYSLSLAVKRILFLILIRLNTSLFILILSIDIQEKINQCATFQNPHDRTSDESKCQLKLISRAVILPFFLDSEHTRIDYVSSISSQCRLQSALMDYLMGSSMLECF